MIEKYIYNYSEDHILRQVYKNRKMIFPNSFLRGLESALMTLKPLSEKAYNDFVYHKLKASKENSFDMHSFISSLCELSIMNSFIQNSNKKESFVYEPQLRDDNHKNVEFSIEIKQMKYCVEVKSPNFEKYNEKLNELLLKKGSVIRYETRMFNLTEDQKAKCMTSTDTKLKDFLVDTSKKFPDKLNNTESINILFICWNDHTDQPCTGLKHPMHGLLTKNSWYKDKENRVVEFSNIDLIFVSDLYQSILAHIFSGDIPLSGLMTGVPYFERNARFLYPHNILNPFKLPFSRNVLIKPDKEFREEDIFSLPIAFSDQFVDVVDEEYVLKNCNEIKFTYD